MGKKNKKVSIFVDSILNSLWLIGFCMVILLFCFMFLGNGINEILRFCLGIVVALPLFVLFYMRGNIVASKEFSARNAAIAPDKILEINKVPFVHGLIMIAPYTLLLLILVLLGNITGIIAFQSISLYMSLPMTLCFMAVGVVGLNQLSWFSVLSVSAFLVLMLSVYFFGFYKTLRDKEKSFQDMLNEVRFNIKH